MRNSLTVLRAADPARHVDFQGLKANPVFDELLEVIVAGDFVADDMHFGEDPVSPDTRTARSRLNQSKRPRLMALIGIAAALVLIAAGLTIGLGAGGPSSDDSLPSGTHVTPWHAARLLPVTLRPSTSQSSASWQLVSLVVDQGWHVNTTAPPLSQLSCPTVTTCYALAFRYASPKGGVPESVSLYVSLDLGTTWSVLPMPTGFLPISQLSCPTDRVCGVGGTQGGQPAYAETIDGGHQWEVVPMAGPDPLQDLVCRSAAVCVGVLGSGHFGTPSTSSSIVRTDDGGASWTSTSVPISGTVLSLSCPTDQVCVAVGYPGIFRGATASGFVLKSDDGGQSWTTGSLPQNFGFTPPPLTSISCAGAKDCMAIGVTSIPNPMLCQAGGRRGVPPPGFDSCDTSPTRLISAVVTSSNGGATWRSRPLPADIPIPQLFSLSCASATVCWAAGQESVPQVIGNVHDEGSPVMVGTTDGGATWSKATFSIPSDAPNYLGQSYLAVGDISCPATSACLALGIGAASAPSTPIYRYGGDGSS